MDPLHPPTISSSCGFSCLSLPVVSNCEEGENDAAVDNNGDDDIVIALLLFDSLVPMLLLRPSLMNFLCRRNRPNGYASLVIF